MSLQNLVQDQSCGQMNPLANLGNQMSNMGNNMADIQSGFTQARPDFPKMRPGHVAPGVDQVRVDAFTKSFEQGPGLVGPEMFQPPPMVQQQRPANMATDFSRLQIRQSAEQNVPSQWTKDFQQRVHNAHMGQAQLPNNWGQEFQNHQMRPQMMNPQMMNPQMMNPQMMNPQMCQQMPRQVKEQKKQEVKEPVKAEPEQVEVKESPQEMGGGLGMNQAMLDNLANSDDPKWRNSNFLKFVTKISNGEIELKDNQAIEVVKDESKLEPDISTLLSDDPSDWAKHFEEQYKDMAMRGLPAPERNPEYQFAKENNFCSQEDPFSLGLQLFKEGKLKPAINAFEAAVQKDVDNAEAWRYLGAAHAEHENEQSAIAALLKCIDIDPYNLPALLMLGVSYTNDFEEKRALNYLKTWMFNHPDYQEHISGARQNVQEYEEYYASPGNSLDGGLHEQVTKMFLDAVKINPNDADLHQVLGVLYHLSSDFENAIQAFRTAVKLRPNDPNLWNKLGATQANGNASAEAVKAYKRALQLRPTYVRALSNLAIAFANQGLNEDAARAYLATLAQNPHADHVWTYLRISLSQMGRSDLCALVNEKNVELFRPHFQF